MSNQRFIIKYCNILDTIVLIDTLERMPLINIVHGSIAIHGWICNDMINASDLQDYFESVCGFQKRLFNPINSFEVVKTDWYDTYAVIDNQGKSFRFDDKQSATEFKEWLDMELKQ